MPAMLITSICVSENLYLRTSCQNLMVTMLEQSTNHISLSKKSPRCYVKSPTAQDAFWQVSCFASLFWEHCWVAWVLSDCQMLIEFIYYISL